MDKAFAYVVSALIGGFRVWIFVAGLPILQLAHIVDGGRVGPHRDRVRKRFRPLLTGTCEQVRIVALSVM